MKPPTKTIPPAARLRDAGLRRTPVRLGVLEVLDKTAQPLGVPQILAKLPEHTDAVTVYRTLNSFTRKKLVHRIRGEDRTWRYALDDPISAPQHQHPHFVCERCGKVECLDGATVPARLIHSLDVGPKRVVSYAEVVLHGSCARCSGR